MKGSYIMEIMSVILEIFIVLEIGIAIFLMVKYKKQQSSKNIRKQETSKMVKKILLNNKWENIDDMIGMLRKDSIHIHYKLK